MAAFQSCELPLHDSVTTTRPRPWDHTQISSSSRSFPVCQRTGIQRGIEHAGFPGRDARGSPHSHTHPWGGRRYSSHHGRRLRNICRSSGWPGLFPRWTWWHQHCHLGSHPLSASASSHCISYCFISLGHHIAAHILILLIHILLL